MSSIPTSSECTPTVHNHGGVANFAGRDNVVNISESRFQGGTAAEAASHGDATTASQGDARNGPQEAKRAPGTTGSTETPAAQGAPKVCSPCNAARPASPHSTPLAATHPGEAPAQEPPLRNERRTLPRPSADRSQRDAQLRHTLDGISLEEQIDELLRIAQSYHPLAQILSAPGYARMLTHHTFFELPPAQGRVPDGAWRLYKFLTKTARNFTTSLRDTAKTNPVADLRLRLEPTRDHRREELERRAHEELERRDARLHHVKESRNQNRWESRSAQDQAINDSRSEEHDLIRPESYAAFANDPVRGFAASRCDPPSGILTRENLVARDAAQLQRLTSHENQRKLQARLRYERETDQRPIKTTGPPAQPLDLRRPILRLPEHVRDGLNVLSNTASGNSQGRRVKPRPEDTSPGPPVVSQEAIERFRASTRPAATARTKPIDPASSQAAPHQLMPDPRPCHTTGPSLGLEDEDGFDAAEYLDGLDQTNSLACRPARSRAPELARSAPAPQPAMRQRFRARTLDPGALYDPEIDYWDERNGPRLPSQSIFHATPEMVQAAGDAAFRRSQQVKQMAKLQTVDQVKKALHRHCRGKGGRNTPAASIGKAAARTAAQSQLRAGVEVPKQRKDTVYNQSQPNLASHRSFPADTSVRHPPPPQYHCLLTDLEPGPIGMADHPSRLGGDPHRGLGVGVCEPHLLGIWGGPHGQGNPHPDVGRDRSAYEKVHRSTDTLCATFPSEIGRALQGAYGPIVCEQYEICKLVSDGFHSLASGRDIIPVTIASAIQKRLMITGSPKVTARAITALLTYQTGVALLRDYKTDPHPTRESSATRYMIDTSLLDTYEIRLAFAIRHLASTGIQCWDCRDAYIQSPSDHPIYARAPNHCQVFEPESGNHPRVLLRGGGPLLEEPDELVLEEFVEGRGWITSHTRPSVYPDYRKQRPLILRGGGIVAKLNTKGMPTLPAEASDAETFINFAIGFKSWAAVSGSTAYIIGPAPVNSIAPERDAEGNVTNQSEIDSEGRRISRDLAEGLQYLCHAIESPGLSAATADNASGSGPDGWNYLKREFLPGGAEEPATLRILNSLVYDGKESILSFRNQFIKIKNALRTPPADESLIITFRDALTLETGGMYEDCVTTASGLMQPNDEGIIDLIEYTKILSRLCSEKRARNEKDDDRGARGLRSSTHEGLADKIKALETHILGLESNANGRPRREPRSNRTPEGDKRNTQFQNGTKRTGDRICPRCGGKHPDGRRGCTKPKQECSFVLPDGVKCLGDHVRKVCFLEDPQRCDDPRLRDLMQRKKDSHSTSSIGGRFAGRHAEGHPSEPESEEEEDELILYTNIRELGGAHDTSRKEESEKDDSEGEEPQLTTHPGPGYSTTDVPELNQDEWLGVALHLVRNNGWSSDTYPLISKTTLSTYKDAKVLAAQETSNELAGPYAKAATTQLQERISEQLLHLPLFDSTGSQVLHEEKLAYDELLSHYIVRTTIHDGITPRECIDLVTNRLRMIEAASSSEFGKTLLLKKGYSYGKVPDKALSKLGSNESYAGSIEPEVVAALLQSSLKTPKRATHDAATGRALLYIDTGATAHIISDPRLLTDLHKHRPCHTRIQTGSGEKIAKSRGPAHFCTTNRKGETITLYREVIYCPDFSVNLYSPQADLNSHGTMVHFNHDPHLLLSGKEEIPFDAAHGSYTLSVMVPETAMCTLGQAEVTPTANTELVTLWHRRLGHYPVRALRHLPDTCAGVPKFKISKTETESDSLGNCQICPLANMKSAPHKQNRKGGVSIMATAFGDRIHMDLCGPISPASFEGRHRYLSLFVDEYTLTMGVYPIRHKNDQLEVHKRFCADYAAYGGQSIKEFHSDNGGEFMSNEYIEHILESGANKTTIVPMMPNQNAIAEGAFWRIFSIVRALLKESGLGKEHWAAAAVHAAYILNRTPKLRGKRWVTPYELLTGRKPNLNYVRIFGCSAHGLIPKLKREGKLADLSQAGYYLGKSRTQRGFLLFIPGEKKYRVYRTAKFHENIMYKTRTPVPSEERTAEDDDDEEPDTPNEEPTTKKSKVDPEGQDSDSDHQTSRLCSSHSGDQPCTFRDFHDGAHSFELSDSGARPSANTRQHQQANRATPMLGVENNNTTTQDNPKDFENVHTIDQAFLNEWIYEGHTEEIKAFVSKQKTFQNETEEGTTFHTYNIPRHYCEAVHESNSSASKWKAAMKDEMDSHDTNETWVLEPRASVPPGKKVIGSTWTFDLKPSAKGGIDRYKGRLCGQGFSQIPGYDFYQTYSNTVRYDTLRIILAVSAAKNYRLTGADIKTAYLNGTIDEGLVIYMRQPRGFEKNGPNGEEMVCRLKKSIYGLKQSGARWEQRLVEELLKYGFTRCVVDPCLYLLKRAGDILYLIVYVDDLIISSSSDPLREKVIGDLADIFKLKDSGDLTWVFGTGINQDLENGTVSLNQTIYIENLVHEFLPKEGNKSSRLRVVPCNDDILDMAKIEDGETIMPEYRSIIGKLGWLSMISRPDISYAYSMLARHCSAGTPRHYEVALGVVRYLEKTKHYKLEWSEERRAQAMDLVLAHSKIGNDFTDPLDPLFFCDASYGGERPMGGDAGLLFGGPFTWNASRLPVTPLSASESEYITATRATVVAKSTGDILTFMELRGKSPITLLCDNLAVILVSENNTSSKRMKHIATRIAFLREQVEAKNVQLFHIGTKGQVADIFTKPLAASVFHFLRPILVGPAGI